MVSLNIGDLINVSKLKNSDLLGLAIALSLLSVLSLLVFCFYPEFILSKENNILWGLLALWVLSIIFIVLAFFRWLDKKNIQTITISVSNPTLVNIAEQADGEKITQIISDMEIYNLTSENVYLSEVILKKPLNSSTAFPVLKILVCENNGKIFGKHPITPRNRARARVHLLLKGDHLEKIYKKGIYFELIDQHHNHHPLRILSSNVQATLFTHPYE